MFRLIVFFKPDDATPLSVRRSVHPYGFTIITTAQMPSRLHVHVPRAIFACQSAQLDSSGLSFCLVYLGG